MRSALARTGWLSLALTIGACSDADPAAHRADVARSTATHVGRAVCAACHERADAAWQGSHHDLAMQHATAASVLGNFDEVEFVHGGVSSLMFRRGDAFVVRTDGADGALREFTVAYTFGVEPLQQYLVALPGGRLQALPIAWDSRPAASGGQRWFHLYQGETIGHDDPLHWTGELHNWNQMCAACHSTHVQKNFDPASDSYATTWAEIDVACEACHGPGSAHVAWAEAGALGGEPNGLLVDLADRSVWRREPDAPTAVRHGPAPRGDEVETCAFCHSRRSQTRPTVAFGAPLLDSARPELLEAELYFDDGQIRDEVYEYGSFVQSAMHEAGVTCSDCHEPHSLTLRAQGNALCAQCHDPGVFDTSAHHRHAAGSSGSACVACHMPERTYMVVDPRRDHSLRVPQPELAAAVGAPDACTACHTDRDQAWAAASLRGWGVTPRPHFGTTLHAVRQHAASPHELAAALRTLAEDATAPSIARATALAELGGHESATAIAALHQRSPDPLLRLGALRALAVDASPARGIALAALGDPLRTLRADAALLAAPFFARGAPTSASKAERSAFDAAAAEFAAIQALHADRDEGPVHLGLLATALGDIETAKRHYQAALRRHPGSVRAAVNLADLHRSEDREDLGARVLTDALRVVRGAAAVELHHALGLARVRAGDLPAGLAQLELAASHARDDAVAVHYALALALQASGETPRAVEVLTRLQRRVPFHADVLYALATIERDRGDLAAARRWAVLLVEIEPRATELLDELRER